MLFFCKGVLETLIMLGWKPDIVHCHGWITSMLPMYLKTKYRANSIFSSTHIITSLYNQSFLGSLNKKLREKILQDDQVEDKLELLNKTNSLGLYKHAAKFSDAIIFNKGFGKINEIKDVVKKDVEIMGNGKEELTLEEYESFYNHSLMLETA